MNRDTAVMDDFFDVNVKPDAATGRPRGRDEALPCFEPMRKGFPELRNFLARKGGGLVVAGDEGREADRR